MKSSPQNSLQSCLKPSSEGLPLAKGYHAYLESLRRGLLAKGKPLDKISLHSKDLSLLKKFLYQCGFSQKEVERFLRELVESNPHGKINLSQFFRKIAEFDSARKKIHNPITLDPSAIPYIESALRDCGLTPKAAERILNGARVQGGRLDLNKLLIELKGISDREMTPQNKLKLVQFVRAIERAMGRTQVSKEVTQGNQVKPDHNVAEIAARLDKGNEVPAEVKATIGEIVERAAITEGKDGRISSPASLSRLESRDLRTAKEIGRNSKKDKKDTFLSPLKEKENPNPKMRMVSDVDRGGGLRVGVRNEGEVVKTEAKIFDTPPETAGSHLSDTVRSETVTTVKENPNPVRHFLPSHLINQVRKQIARALVRGEGVIKLQLRPPNLGSLRVEMDIKDNILKLGMIAENSSVKEILLSNVHQLREALVEQGVKLERLDIQISYNFDQSLAHSKEGLKEGKDQSINGGPFSADDGGEDVSSGPGTMAKGDRLLDLMA